MDSPRRSHHPVERIRQGDLEFVLIWDRIPGFHTDFTQIDRSGLLTLRHPGQPHNAQMPMNTKKNAPSAGLPAEFCGTQNLYPYREAHSAGRLRRNLNPSRSAITPEPLRSPGFERVASFASKAFLPRSAIRHGRRQPLPFGSKRGLPWGYGLQKVNGIARIVPPKP